MPRTCLRGDPDELCIASREPIPGYPYVVLETGPHRTATSCQNPFNHFGLMPSNAGCRPGSIRKRALKLAVQKIEDAFLCRQCILDSHHELNVRAIADQAE